MCQGIDKGQRGGTNVSSEILLPAQHAFVDVKGRFDLLDGLLISSLVGFLAHIPAIYARQNPHLRRLMGERSLLEEFFMQDDVCRRVKVADLNRSRLFEQGHRLELGREQR